MRTLSSTSPVARTPHRCDYCAEPIPAGQRYLRWVVSGDGELSTSRAHVACDSVAEDYYSRRRTYQEERWVCSEPLEEWAGWQGDPGARLATLAEAHAWPDGEVERLSRWMALRTEGEVDDG